MKNSKTFALMILFFNCENTILRVIENCGEFVDKIYISYSKLPWTAYNKSSRKTYLNNSNLEILKSSKYINKLEIVQGVWETDEDQRNEIIFRARSDGFDYMIFQDADEFYLPSDYKKNIEMINANPDYMMYQTPWMTFWKSIDYVILHREHLGNFSTIFTTCSCFAMNLKKNVETKLTFARIFPTTSVFQLTGICYHLSYVLSDFELKSKINTWGHSQQVSRYWYKYKWLSWNENKKYLSPFNSIEWIRAIPFYGEIPSQLIDFPKLEQETIELTIFEKVHSYCIDFYFYCIYNLKKFKKHIIYKYNNL
jgi:hypothetical protein